MYTCTCTYVSVRPEKLIIRFSSKGLKNSGVGAWVNFIFHFIFYYDSLLILVSLNFYMIFPLKDTQLPVYWLTMF